MSATKTRQSKGFTAEEKAAMKERAKELKAEKSRAEGEKDLLAKIAEMKGSDRTMAKRVHEIVKATAPDLVPRTWYGMPAYRNEDDKVVCFFKHAGKFKSRYAILGFNDAANLDAGNMWPTEFALKKLTPAEEKKVSALVKKAVSLGPEERDDDAEERKGRRATSGAGPRTGARVLRREARTRAGRREGGRPALRLRQRRVRPVRVNRSSRRGPHADGLPTHARRLGGA